jgi:hypothetical protein
MYMRFTISDRDEDSEYEQGNRSDVVRVHIPFVAIWRMPRCGAK